MTKEECHEKCEKRYPRSLTDSYGTTLIRSSRRKKPLARLPTGYSGKKPVEKTAMLRHIVLDGLNRTYYKSEPSYIDYGFCVGYRYKFHARYKRAQTDAAAFHSNSLGTKWVLLSCCF
ncbi:hypothetical protein OESDEN_24208 [Oesophagostomum dentatum]|uniref:Uncharacterized protein n=1 Tax=Oesophagostomum dentatum TaxID=61180 RepID=A0A0B1RY99_OESDE|nr:hypothetical protein OESDEN_24208 [Oesophagostomum dentatum]